MKTFFLLLGLILLANCTKLHTRAKTGQHREDQSPASFLQTSGLTLTSFTINAEAGNDAKLTFSDGNDALVAMSLIGETGSFVLQNQRYNIIEIDSNGEIIMGISTMQVKSFQFFGDFTYNGEAQWKQVIQENFKNQPTGWDLNTVTQCSGVYMLGGYCVQSVGTNGKNYTGLPPHTLLRIMATFHFIDDWTGETAYLQANDGPNAEMEYLWTLAYDSTQNVGGINVCGNPAYPEGRFSTPIDVTIPHTADSVGILFGSTVTQDPCEESWGISSISIYIM